MLWLTCSLLLRLAAVPFSLASFPGGDHDAGRGGHHQPMATCSAQGDSAQTALSTYMVLRTPHYACTVQSSSEGPSSSARLFIHSRQQKKQSSTGLQIAVGDEWRHAVDLHHSLQGRTRVWQPRGQPWHNGGLGRAASPAPGKMSRPPRH